MTAQLEKLEGLKYKVTVSIPEQETSEKLSSRLQKMIGEVRLDGFRPGKVPMRVMEQRFGEVVRREILEEILKSELIEVLSSNQLEPTDTPKITPLATDVANSSAFEAEFEVYPEVSLRPLHDLHVEGIAIDLTDDEVEQRMLNFCRRMQDWTTVSRAAALQDQVTIDYIGRIDGQQFEGGASQNAKVVLGNSDMIPGFEEAIIGHAAGETFDITVRFPEDYDHSTVAGQEAVFTIVLHEVAEGNLDELTDEFVQTHLNGMTIDTLRADIRKTMHEAAEQRSAEQLREAALEALWVANPIELPESLLRAEQIRIQVQALRHIDTRMLRDVKAIAEGDAYAESARRRVAFGILMNAVVNDAEIKVTDEQLAAKLQELAVGHERPEEVISAYYADERKLDELRNMLLEELAIQHILSQATVTKKPVSFDEYS